MHAHAMSGHLGARSPRHFDPRSLARWLAMSGHRGFAAARTGTLAGCTASGPTFGPGGFARGPRARRGDVRAALLVLLAEEPRNGYGLMPEIEARSNGAWRPSPGSVYPALSQARGEGLVRALQTGGRKLFDLTRRAAPHVNEHADELGTPWEEVGGGEPIGELRTLVFSVGAAVMQVVQAGSANQVAEAAEALRRPAARSTGSSPATTARATTRRPPRRSRTARGRGGSLSRATQERSSDTFFAVVLRHMETRGSRVRATMSDTFWVLILGVVVLFAFFLALGAINPGEVVWLTLAILVLGAALDGARRLGLPPPQRAVTRRRSATASGGASEPGTARPGDRGHPRGDARDRRAARARGADRPGARGPRGRDRATCPGRASRSRRCATSRSRRPPARSRRGCTGRRATDRCRSSSTCTAAAGCSARSTPSTPSCGRWPTRRA